MPILPGNLERYPKEFKTDSMDKPRASFPSFPASIRRRRCAQNRPFIGARQQRKQPQAYRDLPVGARAAWLQIERVDAPDGAFNDELTGW
jgi:hypothetical protein